MCLFLWTSCVIDCIGNFYLKNILTAASEKKKIQIAESFSDPHRFSEPPLVGQPYPVFLIHRVSVFRSSRWKWPIRPVRWRRDYKYRLWWSIRQMWPSAARIDSSSRSTGRSWRYQYEREYKKLAKFELSRNSNKFSGQIDQNQWIFPRVVRIFA